MNQTGRGLPEAEEGAARARSVHLCAGLPPLPRAVGEKVLVERAVGQLPEARIPLLSTVGGALRPIPPTGSLPRVSGAWHWPAFLNLGHVLSNPLSGAALSLGGPERQGQLGCPWEPSGASGGPGPSEGTSRHGYGQPHFTFQPPARELEERRDCGFTCRTGCAGVWGSLRNAPTHGRHGQHPCQRVLLQPTVTPPDMPRCPKSRFASGRLGRCVLWLETDRE